MNCETMKKYLFILLTAIAFVACSDDEEEMSIPHMVSSIPKSELSTEVKDFFEPEMGKSYHIGWPCIPFNIVNLNLPTDTIPPYVCRIIKSQEELANIYTGKKELPEIDFTAYSLILGWFHDKSSMRLKRIVLQDNGDEILLTGYLNEDKSPDHYHYCSQIFMPFWNLYPKLPDRPLKLWANKD